MERQELIGHGQVGKRGGGGGGGRGGGRQSKRQD